jgi:mannose-6-phosphate isomerase-like protein (cupin superfamily)
MTTLQWSTATRAGALALGIVAAAISGSSVGATGQAAPSAQPAAGAPDQNGVRYLSNEQVQALFAKGGTMVETDAFKVLASRRDRDGQAEVHARDTDIMYMLEGTATLVTGGQVVNGKTTAPDEQRGDSISGGNSRPVAKGDVFVIPKGVPHLFKDVKTPFVYYTLKVTQ